MENSKVKKNNNVSTLHSEVEKLLQDYSDSDSSFSKNSRKLKSKTLKKKRDYSQQNNSKSKSFQKKNHHLPPKHQVITKNTKITNEIIKAYLNSLYLKNGNLSNYSCQRDKYELNLIILELHKKLEKQKKKNEVLKKVLTSSQINYKNINEKISDLDKKEHVIEEYEEALQNFKIKEEKINEELNEQITFSKNTLGKLHNMENFYEKEREKLEDNLEKYYLQKFKEESDRFKKKIENLQTVNEDLIKQNEFLERQLDSQIKSLSSGNRHNNNSEKIINLQEALQIKIEENDELINQVLYYKEKQKNNNIVDDLMETIEIHKEKNYELKKKLFEHEEKLMEKEKNYLDKIDGISEKVIGLQEELNYFQKFEKEVVNYKREISDKEREIDNQKRYYNDIIERKKNTQKKQKDEWMKVYNELLEEIKNLKKEVDLLGNENKKLLFSIKNHNYF